MTYTPGSASVLAHPNLSHPRPEPRALQVFVLEGSLPFRTRLPARPGAVAVAAAVLAVAVLADQAAHATPAVAVRAGAKPRIFSAGGDCYGFESLVARYCSPHVPSVDS